MQVLPTKVSDQMFWLMSIETLKRIKGEISGHLEDLSKDIGASGNREMARIELDFLDLVDHVLSEKDA